MCGGLRIKHHGSVEEIYSDGFVLQQGDNPKNMSIDDSSLPDARYSEIQLQCKEQSASFDDLISHRIRKAVRMR